MKADHRPPYLTKSRFRLAYQCETKLFYTAKDKNTDTLYCNRKIDDPFLEALAEGGFQVGELAKLYHFGGTEVFERAYDQAEARTRELLAGDRVTLFEAAIRFGDLFIRADILEKNGNHLNLVEVKAKSYDCQDDSGMLNAKGTALDRGWEEYLFDVAFQKYVLMKAYPGYTVSACLMLCDKTRFATVDGLNQLFFIGRDGKVDKSKITGLVHNKEDLALLGDPILVKIRVDDIIGRFILNAHRQSEAFGSLPFGNWVDRLVHHYRQDIRIVTPVGKKCHECEFKFSKDPVQKKAEQDQGLCSGFGECWRRAKGWTERDFEKPHMFELWNFRDKDKAIKDNKCFLENFSEADFGITDRNFGETRHLPLKPNERQWLQVKKVKERDTTPLILKAGLRSEMDSWRYPLHFIDFETSAVAIPFYKGLRPYEGIAFQFSHHMVHENGLIEHKGQYLNTLPGKFPNFGFVQMLMEELGHDEGSIFRYATHENTCLVKIYRQLEADAGIPGRAELMEFIRSITRAKGEKKDILWEGRRNMVDMCELVKMYHYDPWTRGSNSIKKVLPAVLNAGTRLRQKYGRPVYGTEQMPSLNFREQVWAVAGADGRIQDPYALLEPVFDQAEEEQFEDLISEKDSAIAEGGAAMMAYARMQFTEMQPAEREALEKALLRYCELDTLAMVMIWEYWKEVCGQRAGG